MKNSNMVYMYMYMFDCIATRAPRESKTGYNVIKYVHVGKDTTRDVCNCETLPRGSGKIRQRDVRVRAKYTVDLLHVV